MQNTKHYKYNTACKVRVYYENYNMSATLFMIIFCKKEKIQLLCLVCDSYLSTTGDL